MAFRFLHMADVHLDTPFAGRESLRGTLRSMLREAFEAAIDLAIAESVHAVLITGDLFDSENLSYATIGMVREQFTRLIEAGIAVLYATGNHDASGALRSLNLPEEIIVFDTDSPRYAEVRDGSGQTVGIVAGIGYPQAVLRDNAALRFPRKDSGLPTVGMLHTQLNELAGAGSDYAPCSLGDLQAAGYDYWALGHIHKPQFFEGGTVGYSGCLCGRDFGETGLRGTVLVTIDGEGTRSRFVPLAPVAWLDVAVDGLSDITEIYLLRERIYRAVSREMSAMGKARMMVRVRLTGPCGLYRELTGPAAEENIETLAHELTDKLKALDITVALRGISRPIDVDEWRGRPHMLSEMLAMMDEAMQDDAVLDAILSEIPSEVGLYGAQGKSPQEMRDYARLLLPGLTERLCDQMIKEDD